MENPMSAMETGSSLSSMEKLIPPEICHDSFYDAIELLARTEKIDNILEIGSSAGGGSTDAFVRGMEANPTHPKLYCLEISKSRFTALQNLFEEHPDVRCYHASSVPRSGFLPEGEVTAFYRANKTNLNRYPLQEVLGWRRTDLDYLNGFDGPKEGISLIKGENGLEHFDMVLIDGSAFTGAAELDAVMGARFILLDDINDIKNLSNYKRLSSSPEYEIILEDWQLRNGYAVFRRKGEPLPIHFFTIVLNGKPFIDYHIEIFKKLPFRWHWHIVEGVADQKHDTAWSRRLGGRIDQDLHAGGLSNDGTTDYLNRIMDQFGNNITIYRKTDGSFWDGKIEMVNAPLTQLHEACLLWQVDADELWTVEQICTARRMFIDNPEKTAALYYCRYFVGEKLIISTQDTYGNYTGYEWLRTWRFRPGDQWQTHEPPKLCRRGRDNDWADVGRLDPFSHRETEDSGLIFQHYAYATPDQVHFKEVYYGYRNAVKKWKTLNDETNFPLLLRDFFPWVNDEAKVERAEALGVHPIARKNAQNAWRFLNSANHRKGIFSDWEKHFTPRDLHRFDQGASRAMKKIGCYEEGGKNVLWVRTDAVGDNVLASSMLPHLKNHFDNGRIIVVCQDHIAELYEHCPFVDAVISFDRLKAYRDQSYRIEILKKIRAFEIDIALNSVYSREPLTDVLTLDSGAARTVAFHGDFSNAAMTMAIRDRHDKMYTDILSDDSDEKPELERHKEFLSAQGLEVSRLGPIVWTTERDSRYADRVFSELGWDPQKTIVLFAGAQGEARRYERYGEALENICRQRGFSVLSLGGQSDSVLNQMNLDAVNGRTRNLCGKTTLLQAAAILRRCRLAIGAETGLAHISAAVGTPHVVLFGGGYFGRFMPYTPKTTIVCLPLECYGCRWRCRYAYSHCIRDMAPEVMVQAIKKTLDEPSTKARAFVQRGGWRDGRCEEPRLARNNDVFAGLDVEIIPVETVEPSDGRHGHPRDKSRSDDVLRLNSAGEELFVKGDMQGARDAFEKALIMDDSFGAANNNLGVLLWQAGSAYDAVSHFIKALETAPNDRNTILNCGDVFSSLGRFEDAKAIYLSYLKRCPHDGEMKNRLAVLQTILVPRDCEKRGIGDVDG